MRTLRFALCDDEALYRDKLLQLLNEYTKKHDLNIQIDAFENGNWLIDQATIDYDLIFLDIEMGILNGIDVAKDLREKNPELLIIFVTNHEGFAIQAFQVRAFHYLKKPITSKSLEAVLEMAFKVINEVEEEPLFIGKSHQNVYRIPIKDILYFEKRRNKIAVVTISEEIELYETIKNLEEQLDPNLFSIIHQGYIVSLSKIERIENNQVKLITGKLLPISKANVKDVKEQFMSFLCKERG